MSSLTLEGGIFASVFLEQSKQCFCFDGVVDERLWAQSQNGESVKWNGQRAAPAGPSGCGMAWCGR